MRQFLESVIFFQVSTCRFSPVNKKIPQLIDLSTTQRLKKFAVFAVLMLCLFLVQWYMFVNGKYGVYAKFTYVQPNNRITTRSWEWHRKLPLARSPELTKACERQTNSMILDIKRTIVWLATLLHSCFLHDVCIRIGKFEFSRAKARSKIQYGLGYYLLHDWSLDSAGRLSADLGWQNYRPTCRNATRLLSSLLLCLWDHCGAKDILLPVFQRHQCIQLVLRSGRHQSKSLHWEKDHRKSA